MNHREGVQGGAQESAQEGVVKFELKYRFGPGVRIQDYPDLQAWRKMLVLVKLIGQDSSRYGGYGYGNISQRLGPFDADAHMRRFLITGTQTGGIAELTGDHYAVVTECRPQQNLIVAEGPIKPSAESLTHGTLYALDDTLRCVMHAHSPHIWKHSGRLGIACTSENVAYGTPEMAEEVRRIYHNQSVRDHRIFSMAGHEDGVVTFGRTVEEAGYVMLLYLARAFSLDVLYS